MAKREPLPKEILVAFYYAKPWWRKGAKPCWMIDDTMILPATKEEVRNFKGALGRPFPYRHKYVVMKVTAQEKTK